MNPITIDIKDLLINPSDSPFTFGGDADWSVHIQTEPKSPDNCITIYATGGPPEGLYNDTTHPLTEYPTFQIRARGNDYVTMQRMLEWANSYVNHIGGFYASGPDSSDPLVKYNDIIPQGNAVDQQKDENERFISVRNYYAIREETGWVRP